MKRDADKEREGEQKLLLDPRDAKTCDGGGGLSNAHCG